MAHGPRASRRARPRVSCAAMLQLTALLLVAQIQLPPPRGYVNDFAGVLDSASLAHMEAVITEVRAKTRGEIAVVTLSDIADRPAADVAPEIGRRWSATFVGRFRLARGGGPRGGRGRGLGGGGGGGGGGWGGGWGGGGGRGRRWRRLRRVRWWGWFLRRRRGRALLVWPRN